METYLIVNIKYKYIIKLLEIQVLLKHTTKWLYPVWYIIHKNMLNQSLHKTHEGWTRIK